jgi:hypothetical protein
MVPQTHLFSQVLDNQHLASPYLGPLPSERFGILSDLHIAEDHLANMWALASVLGQLAEDRDDGYLRLINTDQTARDMLRIVEAHGRTKMQYWGFS